jgi:cytochrome c-type biogenesis protein
MALPTLPVVFAAGAATILSPCCLPLIPPLVSGSVGHRLRPLAVVAGSVASFTVLGVLVGSAAALSPDVLRPPALATVIAFGAVMLDDDLHEAYSARASRLAGAADQRLAVLDDDTRPLATGLLLGLLLGVVWLPCVGPVLGAVLAYAATTGTAVESARLLFVYGVGFAVPLLGVAYGGKLAGQSVARRLGLLDNRRVFRRLGGVVLVASGVALLFELDRVLLSAL